MIDSLRAALPAGTVITDPDAGARYWRDEGAWAPMEPPLAVVRAGSTQDVQTVVRWCLDAGVPVVTRGAGTGLSGGANATAGSVVLSLEAMDRILLIDPEERLAVVQPGVVNDVLRAAAHERGLWYPPDPASAPWSSIGGNVATNAGGLCCVKYGVTGDYVLALEIVNGQGEIVRVGRRTRKGVTGYDLVRLFTGSEGTLGVITEVTVRLRPRRPAETTVAGYFSSLEDAGRAVTAVATSDAMPSALELVDRVCLRAVDEWRHMDLPEDAEVLLLARTDAGGAVGEREARTMEEAFVQAGASDVVVSEDDQESEALFEARRLAYPALERLGPVLTEDVCVPMTKVPAMLAFIHRIGAEHDVQIANIAHAGDGNLHPLIILPAGDEALSRRAEEAFRHIMREAVRLGGTVSGEHGVGSIKRDSYAEEVGPEHLAMLHAVKQALDPAGIFNPGKALPDRSLIPPDPSNPAPSDPVPADPDPATSDPRP